MVLGLLLVPFPAAAALEELLVGVTLNDVDRGAFFAWRSPDGDLLFSERDLQAMGFRPLPGAPTDLSGEPHHSLRALAGVAFTFDADAVAVRINAPPTLLASTVIDFRVDSSRDVEYPVGRSAFLNLALDFRDGDGLEAPQFQAASELGLRWGDWLFLGDGICRAGGEEEGFVRLMTRVSRDDRQERRRLTLGDFSVPARDLWATPDLGGLSFAKLYRMDPYRVRHPTYGLAGQTSLPAQALVYLDGSLVRTEKLPPGEFEIRNLDSYGGARRVEVVIRDVYGRETRIERPFYFTDAVLARGLHEYSYNLGWVREDFGSESNRYGAAALGFFHRFGLTDGLTIGVAGQAGEDVVSAGPTLTLLADGFGVASLTLSGGRMDGKTGYAGAVAYEYQTWRFSARARYQRFSPAYRTLVEEESADLAGSLVEAAVSYGTPSLGSVALSWIDRRLDEGDDRTRLGLDYNLGLFGTVSLSASVARVREAAESRTELFAGLSYYPDDRHTVSAQYARQQGSDQAVFEVAGDRASEEGLAWKAAAQWREDLLTLRPWAEFRGRHGVVAGDLALRRAGDERPHADFGLSAAASLYATGGHFGVGRPVTDAFTVVQVGSDPGLSGVRVYQGGEESGATGADGTLFLPEIGSYVHNQISIEPKDIPLGYSIGEVMSVISPAERSGSVVHFDVARYQAVTGRLLVASGGSRRPLEYAEIRVRAGNRSWTVPSGKDGDFFLENAGAGRVVLTFLDRNEERSCPIEIPASEEVIIDLGEVPCEIAP